MNKLPSASTNLIVSCLVAVRQEYVIEGPLRVTVTALMSLNSHPAIALSCEVQGFLYSPEVVVVSRSGKSGKFVIGLSDLSPLM